MLKGVELGEQVGQKRAGDMIPKGIGDMTLKDLIFSPDVEVHKKDNVLKLRRRTSSETVMLEIRSYDDAATVSQSRTYRDKPFSHMESTIAQMRLRGKPKLRSLPFWGQLKPTFQKLKEKRRRK